MEINSELFTLTSDERKASKFHYEGKIFKCLIAPYHSYNDLKDIIPFTRSTYLFPEKEFTVDQINTFVYTMSQGFEHEIRIITMEPNIIVDTIDGCIRILDINGQLKKCPCKTFLGDVNTIMFEILEHDPNNIQISKIIEKINIGLLRTKNEYKDLLLEINYLDDPIIKNKLFNMLIKSKSKHIL